MWIPDIIEESSDVNVSVPAPGNISEQGVFDSGKFNLINIPGDTILIEIAIDEQINCGAGAGEEIYITLYPDESAIQTYTIYVYANDDTSVEGVHNSNVNIKYYDGFGLYDGTSISEVNFIITDNDTTIIIDTTENVNDITGTLINIYLNPASDYFEIVTSETAQQTIAMYDLNGGLLYYDILHNGRMQIDIFFLHEGMYIIELKNGSEIKREKIIVMN